MCCKYLLWFLLYGVFCIRFLTCKFLTCILGLKIKLKKLFPLFLAFIVALREYAIILKFDLLWIICLFWSAVFCILKMSGYEFTFIILFGTCLSESEDLYLSLVLKILSL